MAAIRKSDNIEAHIVRLLAERAEISIHDIARTAGLSKTDEADRKAIRRVLNGLVKRGTLAAKGAARAFTCARRLPLP